LGVIRYALTESVYKENLIFDVKSLRMKKFLAWFIVILVIATGLFVYWNYFFTYSEGYRAGLLQKFSYRGNVFKTYEGELVLSSVESNRNVALASEKFYFSVTEERVARQLVGMEGKMVSLRYQEKHRKLFWRGDTNYIVDSVRLSQ
jgi:hypothetical protein